MIDLRTYIYRLNLGVFLNLWNMIQIRMFCENVQIQIQAGVS